MASCTEVVGYVYDGQIICPDCIDEWITEHNAAIPEHTHQHLSKDDDSMGVVFGDSEVDCSKPACDVCGEEIDERVIHSGCEHSPKLLALADFLSEDFSEIEEGADETFTSGAQEYTVYTDEEADEAAENAINDSLWAFNAEFIASHTRTNIGSRAIDALAKAQAALCEDANELVRALIYDFDHFIKDAISADGRGHFLSGYDGEENEQDYEGVTYYIYRVN